MKKISKNKPEIDAEVVLKNLRYSMKIDYDTERLCDGEKCNPICRCSTIENAIVEEVDLKNIRDRICSSKADKITQYCVDRLLRIHKIYESNKWEISIQRGYYGEEIGDVILGCPAPLHDDLVHLSTLKSNAEKILFVLQREYGYVLPILVDLKEWNVAKIMTKDLSFGNTEYRKKVFMEKNLYKDHDLPRAICVQENDKYRLIDGYHRALANEKATIEIIVGY